MTVGIDTDTIERATWHVNKLKATTTVGVSPVFLPKLTNYDIGQLGIFAATTGDVSNWIMADLLAETERRAILENHDRSIRDMLDKRDIAWNELCKLFGKYLAYGTRLNLRATANAFPHQRRRQTDVLHFTHHKLLVSREEDEQEYWLDQAQAGGWSVHQLESAMRGASREVPEKFQRVMDVKSLLKGAGVTWAQPLPNLATMVVDGIEIEVEAAFNDELRVPYLRFCVKETKDE